MSRSRKKTPCCHVSRMHDRWFKKLFNRRVRKAGLDDIPDGNAYRKMNKSWCIDEGKYVGVTYLGFRGFFCSADEDVDEEACRKEYDRLYFRK